MKKTILVAGITVAILAALVVVGFAFAQRPTPPTPDGGYGMMSGRGGGMMGGFRSEDGYGPMHEAMQEAMAEALGITHEELEARYAAGDTAWTIAQEKGLTQGEFVKLMSEARDKAFDQLVADGTLTQDQADWMGNRMGSMMQNGYGNGTYECMGNGINGGLRGPGGWNTQP
jgi:uncharacterized protein YidB (DUF937 family)